MPSLEELHADDDRHPAAPPVPPRPLAPPTWADRLVALRDDRRVLAGGAVLALALAAATWFVTSRRTDAVPAPSPDVAAHAADPTATTTTTSAAAVFVHVAGAVARPGVVELPATARVVDALGAAGGPLPDADLDRLNLAAKVRDGERVAVARVGEPAPPGPLGAAGGATGASGAGGEPGAVIDLNLATQAELETLPGIGPVLAAAIISERDERGGFGSIEELREVRGIGEARLEALRDFVRV